MVDRTFWVPEYHFTDEQREALLPALANSGGQAEQFLALVESRTCVFLPEKKNLRRAPVQSPKVLRESIEELKHLTERLDKKINSLDPLGDESAILDMLFRMEQPADFLAQIERQLGILQIAAHAALHRAPEPVGGHPSKDHDISFIAKIAEDYERLHGILPPASRSSWFCGFIDSLFSVVLGTGEDDGQEHYRLVAEAFRRIQFLREQP